MCIPEDEGEKKTAEYVAKGQSRIFIILPPRNVAQIGKLRVLPIVCEQQYIFHWDSVLADHILQRSSNVLGPVKWGLRHAIKPIPSWGVQEQYIALL